VNSATALLSRRRALLPIAGLLVAALVALALVLLIPVCGGDSVDRPPITDVSSNSVTYEAQDGVRIAASFFAPPGVPNPPVVILFHEEGGTRAQWDVLVPILVREGYAVLVPDIRGHGESTTATRDGQPQPYQFNGSSVEAMQDVAAALQWLKAQGGVDASRVGVIGSRFGAMLAYASTAVFPEVKGAVAITPPAYNPNNLDPLYQAIPDYDAHDVCFMAGSRRAWEDAATVGIRVDRVCGDRYEDRSDLDGVALLTIDKPITDIIESFRVNVLGGSPTPRD
jgi:dienelactone hydrolase